MDLYTFELMALTLGFLLGQLLQSFNWRFPAVTLNPRINSVLNKTRERAHKVKAGIFSGPDLPIPLLRLSNNGRVLSFNLEAGLLFGEDLTKDIKLSHLVEGIDGPINLWMGRGAFKGDQKRTEIVRNLTNDSDQYLRVEICPHQFANGQGFLLSAFDVTELKTMETQFVQSQKMQAIGQLAGGVAHDFNNLLTAISGYCDLLLLRHEKGDPDFSDLMQIHSNANRAAALVGQLLAYSRKQTLRPTAVHLADVLNDLALLLNRLVGEKVQLRLTTPEDMSPVFLDARQFEQVIINLVVNARDAMPDGGLIELYSDLQSFRGPFKIDGVTVYPGDYIRVRVVDHGIGIPKSQLAHIFEPFFSTKELGEGTGLGLSMVYGIIKQMGGYIFVSSKVDSGTTFSIYIPVQEGNAAELSPVQETHLATRGELTGLRVLLVEDEDPVRAVSARALQSQGVVLTTATSGDEALEVFEAGKQSFDVVVSDVVMPGLNGPAWIKLAREIQSDFRTVFVSGYAKEEFASEVAEIPDVEFLPKPYSLKHLIDMVGQRE